MAEKLGTSMLNNIAPPMKKVDTHHDVWQWIAIGVLAIIVISNLYQIRLSHLKIKEHFEEKGKNNNEKLNNW